MFSALLFSANKRDATLRSTDVSTWIVFHNSKTVNNLPLSDGGVQSLPVGSWDNVVVIDILLMVLLDSSCVAVSRLLSGKNISSHLLLLFSL